MSPKMIEKLQAHRDDLENKIGVYLEKMSNADTDEPLTDAERANFDALTSELEKVGPRIEELASHVNRRAEAAEVDAKIFGAARRAPEAGTGAIYTNARPPAESLSDMVANSDLATYFSEQGGQGQATMRTELSVVVKNMVTSVDVNGAPIGGSQRIADPATAPTRTPILDAIGYEPISLGTAFWTEWPSQPSTAGIVKEGATKPEAAYAPVNRTAALDKYAHWLKLSQEALEDIPRVQAKVSGALADGVRRAAEQEAAKVIVTGPDQTLKPKPMPYNTATGETLEAAIRNGIAAVQEKMWPANAVLINPFDWADIDIRLVPRALIGLQARQDLWGLNVIPSFLVARGTAYVGDFVTAFKFLDRQDFSVAITDSDGEDFTSNIYTLRGEQRGKTVIERGDAIAKCAAKAPAGDRFSEQVDDGFNAKK